MVVRQHRLRMPAAASASAMPARFQMRPDAPNSRNCACKRRIYAGTLDRNAPAQDGGGRTHGDCIRAMIVVSDNRCGAAGLRAVGSGAPDLTLRRDGFTRTSLASPPRTSAADVARFFERARDGTLLGPGGEPATAELCCDADRLGPAEARAFANLARQLYTAVS